MLFPGLRTYRDSGTAARRQRTLGPRNSGARSGPGNTSPLSRPGRDQHPRSIRGAEPGGRGTRRPGRGSAPARQARRSVSTPLRPTSCSRHEELSGRPPLPAQTLHPPLPAPVHVTRGPSLSPSTSSPCGSRAASGAGLAWTPSSVRDPSRAAACGAVEGAAPRAPRLPGALGSWEEDQRPGPTSGGRRALP